MDLVLILPMRVKQFSAELLHRSAVTGGATPSPPPNARGDWRGLEPLAPNPPDAAPSPTLLTQ